jgi:hypothetical protein
MSPNDWENTTQQSVAKAKGGGFNLVDDQCHVTVQFCRFLIENADKRPMGQAMILLADHTETDT